MAKFYVRTISSLIKNVNSNKFKLKGSTIICFSIIKTHFLILIRAVVTANCKNSIWLEEFKDLQDGTTIDYGTSTWILDYSGTRDSHTNAKQFISSGLDSESVQRSVLIDISLHTNVFVSIAAQSNSSIDKDQDYFRTCYIFDGTFSFHENIICPGDVSVTVHDMLSCINTSTSLRGTSSTSNATYKWSGPNGFRSMEQNPLVTIPGNYKLTLINTVSGCTSSVSVLVEQDTTYPSDVIATVSGMLTCNDTIVTLTGSSGSSGVSCSWLDPNSVNFKGNSAFVSIPGTYTLIATNTANGYGKSTNVFTEQNIEAPASLTVSVSNTLSCIVPRVLLSALSATNGVTFLWEGPLGFVSNDQHAIVSMHGN